MTDTQGSRSLKLEIAGMSCGGCVRGVSRALDGIDGVEVEHVQVGSATLSYDPGAVSPDAIAAAVARQGFTVTLA